MSLIINNYNYKKNVIQQVLTSLPAIKKLPTYIEFKKKAAVDFSCSNKIEKWNTYGSTTLLTILF